MDLTESVSKGCFVFSNGFQLKTKKKGRHEVSKVPKPLFEHEFTSEKWYEAYRSMWIGIEKNLELLNASTYNRVLKDVVEYVENCYIDVSSVFYDAIIPCAILLTGINHPDHTIQFTALRDQLLDGVTPHVAMIHSEDSSSVRHMIENMVLQFVKENYYDSDSDTKDQSMTEFSKIKKSACNLSVLKSWFQELCDDKRNSAHRKCRTNHLVIIIPDFEGFNSEALQDFIFILSEYTPQLPFVIVFGIATSVSALHKTFPYQVSSKLLVQVFQSHSSSEYLNKVLENVFLTEETPFHLSDKPFKLLLDIFLFYDFSVSGFIQGLKYCMMEHYYGCDIKSLCCSRQSIDSTVSEMSEEDLENMRHLPSFRPYVESKKASIQVSLLENNQYLKTEVINALNNIHDYLHNFHLVLNILLALVVDLPNAPLGKQIRELYGICMSSPVVDTPEFKQCMLLLGFQSREDIIDALNKCLAIIHSSLDKSNYNVQSSPKKITMTAKCFYLHEIVTLKESITTYKDRLQYASFDVEKLDDNVDEMTCETEILDRQALKEKFLRASHKEKSFSEYEIVKGDFIKFLTEKVFSHLLRHPSTLVFHEIFFFSDVHKVKKHIVGSPRASIHTALNNPAAYLQCKCCDLPSDEIILPTLPDISIAYKLHLECGKMINLYDWLQAFVTLVDPQEFKENEEEERREIAPQIQARFTRAVSELQFLGFIKSCKKKTDHVTRLTW